jgi:hypothetical protein
MAATVGEPANTSKPSQNLGVSPVNSRTDDEPTESSKTVMGDDNFALFVPENSAPALDGQENTKTKSPGDRESQSSEHESEQHEKVSPDLSRFFKKGYRFKQSDREDLELYNPDPSDLDIRTIYELDGFELDEKIPEHRLVRLSDAVIGASELGVKLGRLTRKQLAEYRTNFEREGNLRANRHPEGFAFTDHLGRVLRIGETFLAGDPELNENSNMKKSPYTLDNINRNLSPREYSTWVNETLFHDAPNLWGPSKNSGEEDGENPENKQPNYLEGANLSLKPATPPTSSATFEEREARNARVAELESNSKYANLEADLYSAKAESKRKDSCIATLNRKVLDLEESARRDLQERRDLINQQIAQAEEMISKGIEDVKRLATTNERKMPGVGKHILDSFRKRLKTMDQDLDNMDKSLSEQQEEDLGGQTTSDSETPISKRLKVKDVSR